MLRPERVPAHAAKVQKMLERREFKTRPNLAVFMVLIVLLLAGFALSVIAARTRIYGFGETAAFERGALSAFGYLGIPAFGLGAVAVISLLSKLRKMDGIPVVLDDTGLSYGNLKIRWEVVREAIAFRYLGRPYIGLRTVNDKAVADKLNAAAAKRMPSVFLIGVRLLQRRKQCAFLFPANADVPADELCDLINQYRAAYESSGAASAVPV